MKKGGRRERYGIPYCTEYVIWIAMWNRCYDPNTKGYDRYGARGIRVCERWRDFFIFVEDMGRRPGLEFSIDRINVDGNYEPSNCRWATLEQQASNKRNSLRIKHKGKEWSARALAQHLGVHLRTMIRRYEECGDWIKAAELAKSNRTDERQVYVELDGETRSVQGWCKFSGMNAKTIWKRVANGMTIEEAFRCDSRFNTRRKLKRRSKCAAGGPDERLLRTVERPLTIYGETKTLREWAEQVGLKPSVVRNRIDRDGMTPEQAVFLEPSVLNKRSTIKITIHGETQSFAEWCRRAGVARTTAHRRYGRVGDWAKVFPLSSIKARMKQKQE